MSFFKSTKSKETKETEKTLKRIMLELFCAIVAITIFYGNFACLLVLNEISCEASEFSFSSLFTGFLVATMGLGFGCSLPLLKTIIYKLKNDESYSIPNEVKEYLLTSSLLLVCVFCYLIATLFFGY